MSSSAHRFFVNAALRRFALLCSMATQEQLQEIGEAIEKRAAERAPRGATGDLSSTHRTETNTTSGGAKTRIVFGTPSGMPYVVVQHEHTEFKHPNGGEAVKSPAVGEVFIRELECRKQEFIKLLLPNHISASLAHLQMYLDHVDLRGLGLVLYVQDMP